MARGRLANNKIEGTSGNDTLQGTDGNDSLYGHGGNDTIYGGKGDDYIDGGTHRDQLWGGEGNDTFNFAAGSGVDQINDWNVGDKITTSGRTSIGNPWRVESADQVDGNHVLVHFSDGNGHDGSVMVIGVNDFTVESMNLGL